MNRKEAIYRVGLILGSAFIIPELFFTSCQQNNNFTDEDENILTINEIAGIIIPKTDSPSAKDVNVAPIIINLLHDCYTDQYKKIFTEGLKTINQLSIQTYGKDFITISDIHQKTLIGIIDLEERRQRNSVITHYFRLIKELIILSYFTSEIGCTQALRYLPVPGKFIGDYPYKKGDKAWATI